MQTKNEQSKVILALDQAKHTGWAVYKEGKIIAHGVKVFGRQQYNGELAQWLDDMQKTYGFIELVAEDMYWKDKTAEACIVLAEIRGTLKCWSDESNIPLEFVEPLAVKKYLGAYEYKRNITDSQRYRKNKALMEEAIIGKGYKLQEGNHKDDEADAIAILIYYAKRLCQLPLIDPKQTSYVQ